MIVCTSICANYLAKALVLGRSLKEHHPDAGFVIGLLEDSIPDLPGEPGNPVDAIVKADALGIPNFPSFMFRHSIVEAATSVKGHLFQHLLKTYPDEELFVYLDPDILVLGPFVELLETLKDHEIVLTPHLSDPETTLDAVMDNEIAALQHGVFNLGFLAIRRSENAERFIGWWAERLYRFCLDDIPGGLFTDQRWIDLAPCFFDLEVLRHPAYNAAPWNVSRRAISFDEDSGQYLANGLPLRFFHFSGFDSGANLAMITKYCPDPQSPIYRLRDGYIRRCEEAGQPTFSKIPWTYGFYSNGTPIQNAHRVIYRADESLWTRFPDPFDSRKHPPFYEYISQSKRRRLGRSLSALGKELRSIVRDTRKAFRDGGIERVLDRSVIYFKRRL